MEFGWDADTVAFREEIASFLDAELPDWWKPTNHTILSGERHHTFCREFAPRLAARGYHVPHWPSEYGGRDASPWQVAVIAEEMWRRGEPRGQQYYGANWIGPAIIRYGSDEQKRYFLPRVAAGEIRWCQGFSEPDAGSDLAALRTAAVRDGDEYVVNGSKIWTSYAQAAEWCILVVRTDPAAERHSGISVLLVPMDSPGLEVREIKGCVGEHAFCELFLTDVRVPVHNRLGPENDGWAVTLDALAFERVGAPRYERARYVLQCAVEQLRARKGFDDPIIASRLGEAVASIEAARLLNYRIVDQKARALPPTAEGNVARLASVRAEQLAMDVLFDALGDESLVDGSLADQGMRSAMPAGLAAGSSEVNLNIIARQFLGLPKG
jgi:alkylation response protein AidB-like acyl-CoA dehydrogenase